MAGITDFKIYIPPYRLNGEIVSSVWGRGNKKASRPMMSFDEDTNTMAVESILRNSTWVEIDVDALNYACYQIARFMLVATPSGITLAPEGGAHQSIGTPLIGISQPGMLSFEPAYSYELSVIMQYGFEHMQDEENGGSVYLRLSTKPIEQLPRKMSESLRDNIIKGGYWLREPGPRPTFIIIYQGVVAYEVINAINVLG